jgi:hypothetical protein
MSTALNVNDVVEMNIVCQNVEQVSNNKLHYLVTAVAGGFTDTDAATAFDAQVAPLFKPIMGTDSNYRGVSCQRIQPFPRAPIGFTVANAGAGTAAGLTLPRQTAGIISLKTANSGRGFRGRIYPPFPSATFLAAGGLPTVAWGTSMTAIGNAITVTYNFLVLGRTGTLVPVLWKPKLRQAITLSGGFNLPSGFATQRRRGTFGRANKLPF